MADEPGTDSAQSTEPNTNSTSSNGDNEETIENAKQLYIYWNLMSGHQYLKEQFCVSIKM